MATAGTILLVIFGFLIAMAEDLFSRWTAYSETQREAQKRSSLTVLGTAAKGRPKQARKKVRRSMRRKANETSSLMNVCVGVKLLEAGITTEPTLAEWHMAEEDVLEQLESIAVVEAMGQDHPASQSWEEMSFLPKKEELHVVMYGDLESDEPSQLVFRDQRIIDP